MIYRPVCENTIMHAQNQQLQQRRTGCHIRFLDFYMSYDPWVKMNVKYTVVCTIYYKTKHDLEQ